MMLRLVSQLTPQLVSPLVLGLALAAVVVALPGRAHAQMPAGPALVVDARLGLGVGIAGTSGVVIVPSLDIGVRLVNRVQIGLGIGLFRTSAPAPGGTNSDTSFTLIPMAAIDILRSRDNHVAWYGKIGLPLGARIVSNPNNDVNLFVIGYDLALGARYCPHPNFAFGLEGGVTGVFVDPGGNNGSGTTSFYGALVGTFYWGKGS
jgi:hypothetical protein